MRNDNGTKKLIQAETIRIKNRKERKSSRFSADRGFKDSRDRARYFLAQKILSRSANAAYPFHGVKTIGFSRRGSIRRSSPISRKPEAEKL